MQPVAAQISLYPLRQTSLSQPIDELLSVLRARGLDVRPGIMSSLVVGDAEDVFDGLKQAFERASERGDVVMVATFSNACPAESD